MRERSRSRGIGVEAVASKSAWSVSGCVEWVYTDLYRVYLSLWILPPFPLDTLHREPTCIVALRSCKSFLTTSFLTVLHYGFIFILVSPSLSLSPSRFHRFSSPFSLPSYFLWNENLVRSTIFPLVSIPNILFSFILKKEDSCFREIDGNCYTSSRKVVRHEKVGRRFVWKRTRERSVRTRRRRGRGVGDERGMRPVPFRENPVRHVMYHGRQTGRLMRPSRL